MGDRVYGGDEKAKLENLVREGVTVLQEVEDLQNGLSCVCVARARPCPGLRFGLQNVAKNRYRCLFGRPLHSGGRAGAARARRGRGRRGGRPARPGAAHLELLDVDETVAVGVVLVEVGVGECARRLRAGRVRARLRVRLQLLAQRAEQVRQQVHVVAVAAARAQRSSGANAYFYTLLSTD